MGGNVEFGKHEAQPLTFHSVDQADKVCFEIESLLKELNTRWRLWPNLTEFYSGSYALLYDQVFRFFKMRREIGDVDVMLDREKEVLLNKGLLDHKNIHYARYLGFKRTVDQYVTLWYFPSLKQNVQIDFELVDIDPVTQMPTEWDRWIHSSSIDDIEKGVKGFAHKLLMRALTAPTVETRWVVKGKNLDTLVEETGSLWAFSYKGMRKKYIKHFRTSSGQLLKIDRPGIQGPLREVYQKLDVKDSIFIKDRTLIAKTLLGSDANRDDIESFSSICAFMKGKVIQHPHDVSWFVRMEKIKQGFANLLFEGQSIYKNPEQDHAVKMHVFEVFDRLVFFW